MATPDSILCEHYGADSPVAMVHGLSKGGMPTQWPKSTMCDGSLYIIITCPNCGEREQCIASACDVPRGK